MKTHKTKENDANHLVRIYLFGGTLFVAELFVILMMFVLQRPISAL
jgi:hypothetical protein